MPNQDQNTAPPLCGAAFLSESFAMNRAIRLGARSWVSARPNPPVGCVVLSDAGQVVGEGRHIRPGQPHAEAVALTKASDRAKVLEMFRECLRMFLEMFEVFARVSKFWDSFGHVRTCLDAFRCIRMHSDAFGCVWMRSDAFGHFWKISEIFGFVLHIF